MISVKTDFRVVLKALKGLEKEVSIAGSRALNDSAKSVKVRAARELASEMNLKNQKHVKASLTVYKSSPTTLSSSVIASGRAIPLHAVKGSRATKKHGVSASYGNRNYHIQRGFKYNKAFFKRVGKSRHPIQLLTGPSVPVSMVKSAVNNALVRHGETTFVKRFQHHIGQTLRKLRLQ